MPARPACFRNQILHLEEAASWHNPSSAYRSLNKSWFTKRFDLIPAILVDEMIRPHFCIPAIAAFVFFGAGCVNSSQPASTPNSPSSAVSAKPGGQKTAQAPSGSNSNTDPGILPMGGGAMSPVTNPGAVDGAGSGVNEQAKSAAKSAAEKASQPQPETSTDGD